MNGLRIVAVSQTFCDRYQWVKSGFIFVGLPFGHAWLERLLFENVPTDGDGFCPGGLGHLCDKRSD